MRKIQGLTDEQVARFPEFVQKWTDIGLCTEPADRVQAEHGVRLAYQAANLKLPSKIVWTTSPLAQGLTRAIVLNITTMSSVRDFVGDSVGKYVGGFVGDSVLASVRDFLGSPVRGSVRAFVGDSVGKSVGGSVWDSVLASCYGQHDAGLVSIYDYMRLVLGLTNETSKLDGLAMLAKTSGWILPHEHICWISERHRRVCRNSRGQLHSHDGMAVEYPDGWGVWAWNGVRVTEQIILNPSTITPDQIAKERNAQVRQVMVERIGIERVCQMFNAHSIDKQGNYELLVLNLGDGRKRPYLKMLNPSVGVWHVEGVHPNCRTVQESLNWRNGLSSDQIDDVNGADWIQQGDVILKPDGARKFKSRPRQLT